MVWMILVNMQILSSWLFYFWRYDVTNNFFQNGTNHRNWIFTSWIQAKLDKNHFLCLKTPLLAQSYTHSAFPLFSSENKYFIGSISRDVSFQKRLQNPLVNRFCSNSAKMCLIDKNKKSPSLEVLDRAVSELWSTI